MSDAAKKQADRADADHPAVAALRKKMRGEALSEGEEELLRNATRKPGLTLSVPQASVMAALEERERRGER